jgi:hypothetical protein
MPKELEELSNVELGVALCLGHFDYDPINIRLGAEILSAKDCEPGAIAHLARQERCETVIRHIAECGQRVEGENPNWGILLRVIPSRRTEKPDCLPHWTRFVSMTGVTRSGGKHIEWLRPRNARHEQSRTHPAAH